MSNLSPKMTSMLSWLAREDRPVNVANVQTVLALIHRGLIEYAPNPMNYGNPVRITDAGRAAIA